MSEWQIGGTGHKKTIILVYGKPRSTTAHIERIQAWWLWSCVALQFLVMVRIWINLETHLPIAH